MSYTNPMNDIINLAKSVDEELIVDFPKFPRGMSCSPLESSASKELKQVRFSGVCKVQSIRCDDEGESTPATWYSKAEYRKFHATMISDVQTMRYVMSSSEETFDGGGNIFTGIEHFASQRMLRCQAKYREAHKEAVLEEYCRQDALGETDCKELRKVSKAYSKIGKIKALVLAGNKSAFVSRQNS
mmetsp:Transcript_154/g.322  ORF Transcript_154/g.322 Transcript_154/m.322 type:complete len:186 (+) Transcript_154:213-770(+)